MPETLEYESPRKSPPSADAEGTLKLMSKIHYGLGILYIGAVIFMALQPTLRDNSGTGYLFVMGTVAVLFVVSGFLMARRRWWLFTVLVSAIILPVFPVGTTLGGYTILVLCRREVRELYVRE